MLQRAASPSPRTVLAVLSLGGISYALLQSLVVPALPQIQQSLHTSEGAVTDSIVMRSRSGTVRRVEATHAFEKLERFSGREYRP